MKGSAYWRVLAVRILPTCSHTDAQARPPKSRIFQTFSWGSMTDRQTGRLLPFWESSAHTREGWGLVAQNSATKSMYRPHARGMGGKLNFEFSEMTAPPTRARARDGTSPQNWGLQRIQKWIRRRPARARVQSIPCIPSQIVTEKPPARDDMPTGWSGVSLSRRLGRDSRAFKSSAYITICVRDSTGSKQGVGMGQTGTNANCGRRWMPV